MTTTQQPAAPGDPEVRARLGGVWLGFLVAIPLVWIVVAIVHPMGGDDVYAELDGKVGIWLFVHFAQLVLALGLAFVFWLLLDGRTGTAATAARLAIPVWLVFFSAFDSVTGLASGLAVHHANSLSGAEQAGAASTADYLVTNRITADFSPVWLLQAVAFLVIVIGTARALRSAGASRPLYLTTLAGSLLVFHAGFIAVLGLLAIAATIVLANREGFLLRPAQRAAS